MANTPPPPGNPGLPKESLVVSGRNNRYIGTTFFGSDAILPPETSISNTISYNGFVWTLSEGVTTGRFISGEPFIVIPVAGVTVMSVNPGPTIVTGFTSAETQAAGAGVTFYINGSMKNPRPWWEQREFNWTASALGATVFHWNYDERAAINTKPISFLSKIPSPRNSMADWLHFPVKLIPGDVLVSAKSSFDGDWRLAVQPQDGNQYSRWTAPDMNRLCIEKYGILTTLSSIPTYKDCYRPPVFWHGSSLAERPIFYRHDATKSTENYLIKLNGKSIRGIDIDENSTNIQNEIQNWNNFVTDYWNSTHIPYYSGTVHQTAVGAYDLYNENPATPKGGYMGGGAKIKDQMFQSVFASWISRSHRKIALDKVTQFSIDCWGLIKGGGIANGAGGYHAAVHRPWLVFLGWLYGRNDIINFHQDPQFLARLAPGLTGAFAIANAKVPTSVYYKTLTTQDYAQRAKIYGSSLGDFQGYTAWKGTNPNNDLYHGLTSPTQNPNAEGFGWLYKISGISAAYGYTVTSIESKSRIAFGSFAAIVAHRDFVFRLNGLGPKSGAQAPAILPPNLSPNLNLRNKCFTDEEDCGGYWSGQEESFLGLCLKIISGAGAGPTVYKIVNAYNTFIKRGNVLDESNEEEETGLDPGIIANLRYATFVLDRDFQNGLVDETSVFKIYPIEANENVWSFTAGSWISDLNSGLTTNGKDLTPIYTQKSYNNIADEAMIKQYAIQNHLGITQDQLMIDYVKETYFNENLSSLVRRRKVIGSAYVGSIFDNTNIIGGKVIVEMLGITGNQFLPDTITGLSGQDDQDPELSLDSISLEFIPKQITNYSVIGGSDLLYNGYGITYDVPESPIKIKAIIDDKIFIDTTQPALYNLLGSLKIQFGPFISNTITVESQDEADEYQDKVAFYDFGANRNSNNIAEIEISTAYVKRPPIFQNYAQNNKSIKFNFISSRYAMAGCAGVLPNLSETSKLASTYGTSYLKRINNQNPNEVVLSFNDQGPNAQEIDISNLWYCISGVTLGAGTTSFAMAAEYDYENWVKIDNHTREGNEIKFEIPNLHNGSVTANYNPSTTDDKLIFIRYITDRFSEEIITTDVLIPSPIGIIGLPFNASNYSNWNNTDIVTKYKIFQISSNNTPGNDGLLRYQYDNSGSSNDYRKLNYNHFRLINNNYFDLETSFGLPAFTTFVTDEGGNKYPQMYLHSGYKYSSSFTNSADGKKYYSPKGESTQVNILGTGNVTAGFYDYYIHGQTLIFHLQPVPHTLLWCTGAT